MGVVAMASVKSDADCTSSAPPVLSSKDKIFINIFEPMPNADTAALVCISAATFSNPRFAEVRNRLPSELKIKKF